VKERKNEEQVNIRKGGEKKKGIMKRNKEKGRATAQAVGRRPLSPKGRVLAQAVHKGFVVDIVAL
jgi:hypothetical protein